MRKSVEIDLRAVDQTVSGEVVDYSQKKIMMDPYVFLRLMFSQPAEADYWSELNATMDKMHMAMATIERSGNADIDFVRLMLPHHQGAIDMAKVQLLHGNDPQMRRLAEEIVTDQQLEIELMERWLKARESAQSKEKDKSPTAAEKDK